MTTGERFCLACLAMALVLSGSLALCDTLQAEVKIEPQEMVGPVNRLVFGNNVTAYDTKDVFGNVTNLAYTNCGAGLWNPETGEPIAPALALVKALKVPVLRYPGGCGVHNFDWKKTIGPVAQRPNWRCGLDEYLQVCKAVGAEPLITVSDYTGTAQDAADLVEYLNSPADDAHPWAKRRAANGHPEPYHVKFFELGNETYHGNHQMKPHRQMTAAEYGKWVCEYSRRMKAVDPAIKVSALLKEAYPPETEWNTTVLAAVKDAVDFIVVHTYAVGLWHDNPGVASEVLMKAALAAPEQFAWHLRAYHELIRKYCKRDLPLGITEYNAAFVQNEPVPYRFSLGAALFCGDYLRVLLQPESGVLMANYWQLINEYWGEIKGLNCSGKGTYTRRPAWYVHWLYGNHFGTKLVRSEVRAPRFESQGFGNSLPAKGKVLRLKPEMSRANVLAEGTLQSSEAGDWRIEAEGAELKWTLEGVKPPLYPGIGKVECRPERLYSLKGEARFVGETHGAKVGIQLGDARGWNATHSAAADDDLALSSRWRPFEVRYRPLAETKAIALNLRCEGGEGQVRGRLEIRNLQLAELLPVTFPAAPTLTACASVSKTGDKLYCILVNKSLEAPMQVTFDLGGFEWKQARTWTLTGPKAEATNEQQPYNCTVKERLVLQSGERPAVIVPPVSMTAVEFGR